MNPYLQSLYTIRFSDCDPLAHLNNARYVDYFMNAREDHLKTHYDMDLNAFYRKGIAWVITQHEIAYLRPANLNESVCIQTALIDAGPEHLIVEYVMFDEEIKQLKSVMHSRMAPISLTTGKKEPHDEEFMAFLFDKIVTGMSSEKVVLKERIEHWQQYVKTKQTI